MGRCGLWFTSQIELVRDGGNLCIVCPLILDILLLVRGLGGDEGDPGVGLVGGGFLGGGLFEDDEAVSLEEGL